MSQKLFIWKCADDCCGLGLGLQWHAGTIKHKPFFSTVTHSRAIDFYRTEWAS